MSLSGNVQSYIPVTLDGLNVIDADQVYIDGQLFDPADYVPYVGATKTLNMGAQNIQTSHSATTGNDVVNLTLLQSAIGSQDVINAANFLSKVTTNNQTITGNVQANGGFTFTQNTVLNTLQLQSDDNATMSWTTSVSNGTPNDLTWHAVQTTKDIVFRDTGVVEATGVKIIGATALRAVVTDANKNLATSATTATEIGYLSGVTSGVQSQINALVPYTGANQLLNMGTYLVRSSAVPIAGQDLCNKTYVDGKVSSYAVAKAGDTMTGALLMGTNKITTSYVPVDNVDLTNKLYVDNAVSGSGSKWTLSGSNIYNNNAGNVGIGTTAPVATLHTKGWGMFGDSIDSTRYGDLQVVRAANPGDNKFHLSMIRAANRVSGFGFVNNTSVACWVNNNDTSQTGYGIFLDDTGRVGIGTSAPSYKLHVQGTLGTPSDIYSFGNVGIGTISPTTRLYIQDASLPALSVGSSTTARLTAAIAAAAGNWSSSAAVGDAVIRNDDSTKKILFQAGSGSVVMAVNSSNVGFGTTAPITLMTGKAASYTAPLLILDAGMSNWSTIGAGAVPRGIGQPLLRLGNTSYTNIVGDYYGLGLGYGPNAADFAAAEIGLLTTSQAGNEQGDLLFSTRPSTSNVAATERVRVSSLGQFGVNGQAKSRVYFQTNRTYTPEQPLWTENSHICVGYDTTQGTQSPCLYFHQYNTSTNPVSSISVIGSLAPSISWNTIYFQTGTAYWFYNGTQVAYLAGGGWVNSSDSRGKRDIQPLNTQNSLKKVLASRPVHYQRIYNESSTIPVKDEIKEQRHIGFIAQEQLDVNPYCVSEWDHDELKTDTDDGKRLAVSYNDYIVHLIGAVQELHQQMLSSNALCAELHAKHELGQRQLDEQQKQLQTQQEKMDALIAREEVIVEHARTLEKNFNEYKALTEERFNKLAALLLSKENQA